MYVVVVVNEAIVSAGCSSNGLGVPLAGNHAVVREVSATMVNINGFDTENKSIGLFSDGFLPAARHTYVLHIQVTLKPDCVELLM